MNGMTGVVFVHKLLRDHDRRIMSCTSGGLNAMDVRVV